MSNAPTVFAFDSHAVRVLEGEDREPWFVAADVLSILTLDRKALERLDDDEKGVNSIHTPGGTQEMTVVSEPGLYSLVLGSRKPEAKRFRRWVTHEVLPAIRKTGGYGQPPNVSQQLAAHGVRIRLIRELNRERNPVIRQALDDQLEHVSALIGIPAPARGSIGSDAPPEPLIVTEIWAALRQLTAKGVAFNHSTRSDLLAINIPELVRLCRSHGIPLPGAPDLRRHLRMSVEPRFSRRTVRSAIRSGTVKCWVFNTESATTPEPT
ncbi:MAG: Bro-N domain-containing protein [Moraxellaceae bacterium]|nr:Bro-N domain-containing protein [Moraxellaceae bacterium]